MDVISKIKEINQTNQINEIDEIISCLCTNVPLDVQPSFDSLGIKEQKQEHK